MNEEVYTEGEQPDTPRWYIAGYYIGEENNGYTYRVMTPGHYPAAACLKVEDARLIVGELNHVAELRAEIERMQRSSFTTRQGEAWAALEKRIAALEAIIAGQN